MDHYCLGFSSSLKTLSLAAVLLFSDSSASSQSFITDSVDSPVLLNNQKSEDSPMMDKCVLLDVEIKQLIENGQYQQALQRSYQRESELKLSKSYDAIEFINLYTNLCMIYAYMENYSQASLYAKKALLISNKIQYYRGIISNLNAVYQIFFDQKKYTESLSYLQQALTLIDSINLADHENLRFVVGVTYGNLVECYLHLGDIQEAQKYFLLTESAFESIKIDEDETRIFYLKGKLLAAQGQYDLALQAFSQSLIIAKEIHYTEYQQQILNEMNMVYIKLGDYKSAHACLADLSLVRDSILNKTVVDKEVKLRTEHKERENDRLQAENEKQQLLIENKEKDLQKQKVVVLFSLALAGVLGVSSVMLKRYSNKTKKAKEQVEMVNTELAEKNSDLEEANKLITEQGVLLKNANDELAYKNSEITDSISYAAKIQNHILHPELSQSFPESFYYSQPKDIVSGDFFFSGYSKNGEKVLAMGDCTGHGVPAALLTIFANTHLKDFLNNENDPGKILNDLDIVFKSIQSVTQEDMSSMTRINDSMDISLAFVDEEKGVLSYACSGRPIWIVRDGKVLILKSVYGHLGSSDKSKCFDGYPTKQVPILPGDQIYMFSDGYADQFGGNDEKLGNKRFKDLLLSIKDTPLKDQKAIIAKFNHLWRNADSNHKHEQTDDIMVVGVKIGHGGQVEENMDS